MRLKNKVAIVTGSAKGIGKSVAIELARDGAKVVVSDVDQKNMDETVKEIKKMGSEVIGVKADVSSSSDVAKLVGECLKKFGTVDILVNNAGIYPTTTFDKMSE